MTRKDRLNFEFSPEMQIGSNVPNMIGTAALQFTAYLAQTSLEASIRRRKNKGTSQKSIFRLNPENFRNFHIQIEFLQFSIFSYLGLIS